MTMGGRVYLNSPLLTKFMGPIPDIDAMESVKVHVYIQKYTWKDSIYIFPALRLLHL